MRNLSADMPAWEARSAAALELVAVGVPEVEVAGLKAVVAVAAGVDITMHS